MGDNNMLYLPHNQTETKEEKKVQRKGKRQNAKRHQGETRACLEY
jgi:hypothetical protein